MNFPSLTGGGALLLEGLFLLYLCLPLGFGDLELSIKVWRLIQSIFCTGLLGISAGLL